MLSFGIEYERAFSIAFWSARLPAGSGPPSRAATMIARESFEKSLPRLASAAPFLCLIDDHLLCPDKSPLLHELQEPFVHAGVVCQLRVEGRDDEPAVAKQHRIALQLGQHLDVGTGVAEPWRADEDASERLVVTRHVQVGLEARHLPSIRIAVDVDVHEAEVVAVEHDHPRTRSEHRPLKSSDSLVEAVQAHQSHERGRFPSGDHETVQSLELLRLPNLDRLRTEPTQHLRVLAKIALNGKDADSHALDCSFGRS